MLEADPTTATAVAAVQSDVDQNEADSDAADAALSGRLDVLEADPTTQSLLSAETAARLAGDTASNTYTDCQPDWCGPWSVEHVGGDRQLHQRRR